MAVGVYDITYHAIKDVHVDEMVLLTFAFCFPSKCSKTGNFGILSVVVVCSTSTAYTSLYRDLIYSPKVRYIILNYLNILIILIFESLCLGNSRTLPYAEKISQK